MAKCITFNIKMMRCPAGQHILRRIGMRWHDILPISSLDRNMNEMINEPLKNLISRRGFDRFQPGLESRFAAYRLQYVLTYCEPTDNPAMRLDFETMRLVARVIVWESGHCEMEVLDIDSGDHVFYEHPQFSHEIEFHRALPKLVLYMRDAFGSWSSAQEPYRPTKLK